MHAWLFKFSRPERSILLISSILISCFVLFLNYMDYLGRTVGLEGLSSDQNSTFWSVRQVLQQVTDKEISCLNCFCRLYDTTAGQDF